MNKKNLKRFFNVMPMGIIIILCACTAEGELFENWDQRGLVIDGGEWTKKADFMGYEREGAVGFSIENKGYYGTGREMQDDQVNYWGRPRPDYLYFMDFWEYDPVSNSWTQKADFPGEGREKAVGFSIENIGYIGTGECYVNGHTVYYQDFWEYDPISNVWTRKADFAGETRSQAVGISIGNKGYIGTGFSISEDSETFYSDFYEYDPVSDSWLEKKDFPGTSRRLAVGFSIGELGYIGMGQGRVTSSYVDFWAYNPLSDSWTRRADADNLTSYGVGFSIGNKGYISAVARFEPRAAYPWAELTREEREAQRFRNLPYYNTNRHLISRASFFEYDPISNKWRLCATIGSYLGVGFSIGDKGYFLNGRLYKTLLSLFTGE